MIKILTRKDMLSETAAFNEMYSARAAIFSERLGWKVSVVDGYEIDDYDRQHDPVYIVSHSSDGMLTGSLRLLPTTGDTMLGLEFRDFFDPVVDVKSPTVWECTRFCIHPTARSTPGSRPAVELLHALCALALRCGITHIVGVYEAAMVGVYRRIGWSPELLAISRPEIGRLMVGMWAVSDRTEHELARRINRVEGGLKADLSALYQMPPLVETEAIRL